MTQRSWFQRSGYWFLQYLCRVSIMFGLGYRALGRQHIPAVGGGLVCSNHQSYFDPVLVGLCFRRRMNYLARKTLFRFAPLGWLIGFVDAIPLDREGFGLAGLKETLRRLKRAELVLIFPEGTRCRDGRLAELKPGFCAVARRGRVPLIPVGIDGAYEAWPRSARWPRRTPVCVTFGPPLSVDEVAALTDDELVREVHRRLVECCAASRAWRHHWLRQPVAEPNPADPTLRQQQAAALTSDMEVSGREIDGAGGDG